MAALENYCGDIDYISRSSDPHSTTARETIHYLRHLQDILDSLKKKSLILDLGCGDGRFTELFLSSDVGIVVAMDLGINNLKRLSGRLGEDDRARVLLVQADALRLPIRRASLDAVFAIGVLNAMGNDLAPVCSQIGDRLASGGILVSSDPTLEGALLYALVRHDFDEFLQVARTHTKTIDYDGERSKRYPVFEHEELLQLLEQSGFVVEDVRGIPLFPSLVFGGALREKGGASKLRGELAKVVDELGAMDMQIFRVRIYVSRWVGSDR